MKLPISMLRDYVVYEMADDALADLLTMAGFEVEEVEIIEGESVLDIKVCSNRGDGLSALGLSREILAKIPGSTPTKLYLRAEERFTLSDENLPCELNVSTKIETKNCTRFAYRGWRGFQNGDSPEWIQKRLRQIGMRPINLMVDLTNYVMVELGQPLHAYDLDKLAGPEIVVREATLGESLTTLDGKEHALSPGQMMICDATNPIGVAGVMGGENTELSSGATNILLESAHFSNLSVRKTRKQLGLNTDASYRFERSVDPYGVVAALNRVKELADQSGQTESAVLGVSDLFPTPPKVVKIELQFNRVRALLGMNVQDSEISDIFKKLGNQIVQIQGGLEVTPPSWRADLVREEDLIEDIGRIYGYEHIPARNINGTVEKGGVWGKYEVQDSLIKLLLNLGFDQSLTHTLRGTSLLDSPTKQVVAIRQPSSPDTSFLRTSLLPGLAEVLRKSGGDNGHCFELGPVFEKLESDYQTTKQLGVLSSGNLFLQDRKGDVVPVADFYSLKGTLEALYHHPMSLAESFDVRFHPTRQAQITSPLFTGIFGELHPKISAEYGFLNRVILAELNLTDHSYDDSDRGFKTVSRNPAVRRDIAFSIRKSVPFCKITDLIYKVLGSVLEDLWLFDVYEGKGIEEGEHSLAIALTLRKVGSNFTDEEANQLRELVVKELESLEAKRR